MLLHGPDVVETKRVKRSCRIHCFDLILNGSEVLEGLSAGQMHDV